MNENGYPDRLGAQWTELGLTAIDNCAVVPILMGSLCREALMQLRTQLGHVRQVPHLEGKRLVGTK
jgi:hypothetical protein